MQTRFIVLSSHLNKARGKYMEYLYERDVSRVCIVLDCDEAVLVQADAARLENGGGQQRRL